MKKILTTVLVSSVLPTVAMAAEPDFRISFNAMRYSMKSGETKPASGASTKAATSGLTTPATGSLEFAAFHNGWALYALPSEQTVAIGKSLSEALEAGVTASLMTNSITEPAAAKGSSSNHTIGVYAIYGMDLGMAKLEVNLAPAYNMGSKSSKDTAGTETKESSGGLKINGGVMAYSTLGKNLELGAGLDFRQQSITTGTTVGSAAEVKVTNTEMDLGIVIGRARLKF